MNEEEAIPPPPDKQDTPVILYRDTNTTGKKINTCRVNESRREAREHFASRLKGWVRFRPRTFFSFFVFFSKNEEEASPPPPTNKILRVYYIGIPIQQVESLGSIPT